MKRIDEREYEYKITAAGRVNLIGEHIDYCGGKVLPVSLSMCNAVYIRPNNSNTINISWTTLPNTVSLDINRLEEYRNLKYGNYQAGCAHVLQREGYKVIGCDMFCDCTVPFGAGLSSSAGIEVSTILALSTLSNEKISPLKIALLAQKVEREFVGVNCGIMDQYISACGKKDHAVLLDCNTLTSQYIPLNLGGYSLVAINCNQPHNLIHSEYNLRRKETEIALSLLQNKLKINSLAEISVPEFEKNAHLLPQPIRNRARHVVEECERVEKAVNALKSGSMFEFGTILNESHSSLRNLYEVTGKALDTLVEGAQSHAGCLGSRMTGGGFGGCTVSLVKSEAVEDFKHYVSKYYRNKIGYSPTCYDVAVADGISITKI